MKTHTITVLAIVAFLSTAGDVFARKALFDAVVKVVTGGGAVFATAQAAEAGEIHSQKKDIVSDLKSRGINPRDGALFQVSFAVDPDAGDRWFLKPNVYALVQIEGQGDFVPASIAKGYQGQPFTVTVTGRQIRPGGTVYVHILDDKQFWNTAWNSILQTEVPFKVAGVAWITPTMKANVDASGRIKILNKNITFQPPGYLATAQVVVPESEDGLWLATAKLLDRKNIEAGVLQFGQIWVADPADLANLAISTWHVVFWGGLALVLLLIFGQVFLRKQDSPTSGST